MFLKLRPFIYSLAFLLGLELAVFWSGWMQYLILLIAVLGALEGKRETGKWIFSILPLSLALASAGLLYFVSIPLEKQLFILASAFFYYLTFLGISRIGENPKDRTAEAMLAAGSFASLLFIYFVSYGFYLNFLVPVFVLMLTFFFATFLISFQYFTLAKRDPRHRTFFYTFLSALVMSEAAWALNFWPFGYLTTGVVALILYYVIWEVIRSYFLDILDKKRMAYNMAFLSVLIVMVLVSSKWMPNF